MKINEQILQATEISKSIVMKGDFKKSMKIVGKYPVLAQYIKLNDVMYDWFGVVFNNTKNQEWLDMREDFTNDFLNNMIVFSQTEDIKGITKMVQQLKNEMSKLFGK
jgi:hypothetical protein